MMWSIFKAIYTVTGMILSTFMVIHTVTVMM